MCLGIPGRILDTRDDRGLLMGTVDFGGVKREVCLAYVADEVSIGRLRGRPRRLRDQQGGRGRGPAHLRGAQGDEPAGGAGLDAGGGGSEPGPARRRGGRMKYLSEYRDRGVAQALIGKIRATATRPWTLMEVCGGQTHTIVRQGLDELLEGAVEMIHGPGCPVCVTPLEQIDKALAARGPPRRDLHLVRRHAPGPGIGMRPAAGPGPGRQRPGGLFAARCPGAGHPVARLAGGLLRGRIRDHGAGQRDGGVAGPGTRGAATSASWSPTSPCRPR